jgi:hypothetical protein
MGWVTQVLAHSDISGATYLASNVSISVISFFKEPYRGAVADVCIAFGILDFGVDYCTSCFCLFMY